MSAGTSKPLKVALRTSRRTFLQQLGLMSCTCCGSMRGLAFQAQFETPSLSFPAKPHQRLAVTSWPFRAYIESPTNRGRDPRLPGMDLMEFAELVVNKFGVHNINPLLDHLRSTDSNYLDSFRNSVAKAGSHMVDFGLPGRRFASSDRSIRNAAVSDACRWIDIAEAIGSPSVRQHLSQEKSGEPDLDGACSSLAQLAEYGSKHRIVVNLENDNPTTEDPYFIVRVIEKAGNPYLRALPDIGNSLPKYGAQRNEEAVSKMFSHAFNMCHVKEAVQSDSGKTYTVDLKRMFAIAKQSSYRGYFSMEFDSTMGDPFAGTTRLIQQTLENLS